jgi:hypothetical protein
MMKQTETKPQHGFYNCRTFSYLSVFFLFALSATAFAATDPTAKNDEYVDSVYSWGIWELGIEPAAGPRAPANRALNNRARNLQFRPNDNAAYKIDSVPVPTVTTLAPPPPPAPVVPAVPAGPPGFRSGPPTTADPRN